MNELEIVLIGLVLGEFFGLCIIFYLLTKSYKARNWVQHKGLIISSNVEKLNDTGSNHTLYRNKIRYKYIVDSKSYESNNIYFGWYFWQSFPFTTWNINKKYHANDKIIIFYNPKKPSQAVIERNPHSIVFIPFFIMLIVAGVILLICRIENINLLSLFGYT